MVNHGSPWLIMVLTEIWHNSTPNNLFWWFRNSDWFSKVKEIKLLNDLNDFLFMFSNMFDIFSIKLVSKKIGESSASKREGGRWGDESPPRRPTDRRARKGSARKWESCRGTLSLWDLPRHGEGYITRKILQRRHVGSAARKVNKIKEG